jgi:antitoxin (DNA-binding transcriptional repressor) of toxin-antitoxin stability system
MSTTTSVSDLKNNLSAWLRKVRAGQSIVVMDRDVPIARIERIASGAAGADRLTQLHASGLVRPPDRALPVKQLHSLAARASTKPGLLADLLEQRSDDR